MKVVLTSAAKKQERADLLVVGFFEDAPLLKEAAHGEPRFAAAIAAALKNKRFTGKFGETVSVYGAEIQTAQEAVVLGLGKKANHKRLCMRKATGTIIQMAKCRRAKQVRVLLDSFAAGEVALNDAAEILAENARLTSYAFDKYKTPAKDNDKIELETLELAYVKNQLEALKKAVAWGTLIANGKFISRHLIN